MRHDILEWGGKKILRIHSGLTDANKFAIVNESYEGLCLAGSDYPDLSFLSTLQREIKHLEVTSSGILDLTGLSAMKQTAQGLP